MAGVLVAIKYTAGVLVALLLQQLAHLRPEYPDEVVGVH